jgi:hypothetical protein
VRFRITLAAIGLFAGFGAFALGAEREPLLGTTVFENVDAYVEAPQRLIDLAGRPGLTVEERRARYATLVPDAVAEAFVPPLGAPELRVARFVQDEILATTAYRPDDGLLWRFVRTTGTLMAAYDTLHATRVIDRDAWLTAEIALCADLTRFAAGIADADRAARAAWKAAYEIEQRAPFSAGFPRSPDIAGSARRTFDRQFAWLPYRTVFTGWWRSADAAQRVRLIAACGDGPLAPLLMTAIAQTP